MPSAMPLDRIDELLARIATQASKVFETPILARGVVHAYGSGCRQLHSGVDRPCAAQSGSDP